MTLPLPKPRKRMVVRPRRTVVPQPPAVAHDVADRPISATRRRPKCRVIDVPLDKLRPHPLQQTHFGGIDYANVKRLALSMRERGQDEPIEVTSDYVIISGHCRLEAAKLLQWSTIRCRVRHDLTDERAVEQHHRRASR